MISGIGIEKRLDIKQMKKMTYEIIEEEAKKSNIKVNVFPLTLGEYYRDFLKGTSNKFKLQRIRKYMRCNGFNQVKRRNIFLYLTSINISNKTIFKLDNYFDFAATCYHEVRHSIQET
ncbi:MAG: hypothetical protein IJ509_01870 [Bacilli bacterium]|nr:hypothetical protein [Bacilli bacterium]